MPTCNLEFYDTDIKTLVDKLTEYSNTRKEIMAKLLEVENNISDIKKAIIRSIHSVELGQLSHRETEIICLLKKKPNHFNKEIASDLNITESTVKFHLGNIFKKFNVSNKRKLVDILRENII